MRQDVSWDRLVFSNLRKERVHESFGNCTNYKTCGNTNVILGNGLCVKCWDMKVDKGAYRMA